MLNKWTIRTKITLWFSIAIIVMMSLTCITGFVISDRILQKTIRDGLIETIENNVDEIEFFQNIDDIDFATEVDHFLKYKDGFLEVDDDFLDEVNQIYTGLYFSDGSLMYGENPIAKEAQDLSFKDSQIQKVYAGKTLYYVFDRQLTRKGLEGLWLRGVVSEMQGEVQLVAIFSTFLFAIPALVFITIISGYWFAGRMLRPIRKISDSAQQISQGGDLKKRIAVSKSKDELYMLAQNFNAMFERLERAFQSERQFTSDASHELRTPMAVILAQCELALEKERTAEEYKEALEVISRQGQKMSGLISNMLDFTRLELKADLYEKNDIDFTELVELICCDMMLLREKNITLMYEVEQDVHCIGNRDLLTRLIHNLISNAYRYGRESGHIYVRLKTDKDMIHLEVEDDGIGISAEEQEKIFDRFYQSDMARADVGTGLGLSMVKEIARFHQGEVVVKSELGKGSIFTLKLFF